VTERAGKMAFEDVRVELVGFAAAHAVDEIPKHTTWLHFRVHLHQRFTFALSFAIETSAPHDAFFEIEFIATFIGVFLEFADEAARFKHDQGAAEVEHGDELVGRLALVLEVRAVHVAAPQAEARSWGASAKHPSCCVHLVHPWLPMSPLPKSQNQCQL